MERLELEWLFLKIFFFIKIYWKTSFFCIFYPFVIWNLTPPKIFLCHLIELVKLHLPMWNARFQNAANFLRESPQDKCSNNSKIKTLTLIYRHTYQMLIIIKYFGFQYETLTIFWVFRSSWFVQLQQLCYRKVLITFLAYKSLSIELIEFVLCKCIVIYIGNLIRSFDSTDHVNSGPV